MNDLTLDCAQPAAALVSQPAAAKSIQITNRQQAGGEKRQQAARSPSRAIAATLGIKALGGADWLEQCSARYA
jgi:hypothetical protein